MKGGKMSFTIQLFDDHGGMNKYPLLVDMVELIEMPKIEPVKVKGKKFTPSFGQNMTGYIDKIGVLGDVEVLFNSTIYENYNITLLNKTNIDIYVQPFIPNGLTFEDRLKEIPDSLNLTWSIIKRTDHSFTFKIIFDSPLAISAYPTQDTLVIHFGEQIFNSSYMIFSPSLSMHLHEDSHTMRKSIRR